MGNSPKVTELIKLKDENKKVKGMVAEFKSAFKINSVLKHWVARVSYLP